MYFKHFDAAATTMKYLPLCPPQKMTLLLGLGLVTLCTSSSLAAEAADEYAAAQALGVFRDEAAQMVSIDFDVPRYGPLCITIDEDTTLKIAWEEYHNIHRFFDETSFEECDFSKAMAIMSEGMPRPDGITFFELSVEQGNQIINAPWYFACSKICVSNGHKVKVCRGGKFGEANECTTTSECSAERTVDVRSTPGTVEISTGSREYLPVGKVCRPKNGDGYSITSGVDTPESCQKKCDDEASKCGAWEFEDHDLDNKECELHEINVVSYEETLAMGDCEITELTGSEDYRCCWIAKEVVELQQDAGMAYEEANNNESAAPINGKVSLFVRTMSSIAVLAPLLVFGI